MGENPSIWRNRHWCICELRGVRYQITLNWSKWCIGVAFPRYGHFGWVFGPLVMDAYKMMEFE